LRSQISWQAKQCLLITNINDNELSPAHHGAIYAKIFNIFNKPSPYSKYAPSLAETMNPIPLPSHAHYELLLQLLERQTLRATDPEPALHDQIQQLIITLRKAFAQQKQIETICQQTRIAIEYSWSIHSGENPVSLPPQPIATDQG
jgi:hypothetical protein